MTTPALEDTNLEHWGEDGDLPEVDQRPISIDPAGRKGGEDDEYRLAFSTIMARATFEVSISGLFGWITEYRPAVKADRMTLLSLVDLAQDEMNAWPCRRLGMIKQARADQEDWKGKIPGEVRDDQIELVDWLFDLESSAAQRMTEIAEREIKWGRQSVRHLAGVWFTNRERINQVQDRAAAELCQEAYMYLSCRRVETDIIKSIARDRAAGLPIRDYSDLAERIKNGAFKGRDGATALATEGPRLLRLGMDYAMAEQSYDNPKMVRLTEMLSGAFRAREKSRQSKRRPRDEDDD